MTGPRPYSPDNPFAAPDFRDVTGGSSTTASRYSPDNPFSPTAVVARETFGPVAGTLRVNSTQGPEDTGALRTVGEMARTVGGVAKAIALPVKGEVGRRLMSAGGHLLTNTAEGGSLTPLVLAQVARYLTAPNAAQQAAETITEIPAEDWRVQATREAYRTLLNDPMDRALGITPLSNRPDVAPFDMAAQFAVPVLGERAAALGGNLAFRAGASGVTRDVAAGLNRGLTAEPAVTPPPPDLPPEVRFPPEKAAVVSVLDKQRAWDQTGRAAFVRGEGPGFGGEVPRAMTESGQPTPETASALSPDNPFAPQAGAPRDQAAVQEGLFGERTLVGNEQTSLLPETAGRPTLALRDTKIGADETARLAAERPSSTPAGETPLALPFEGKRGRAPRSSAVSASEMPKMTAAELPRNLANASKPDLLAYLDHLDYAIESHTRTAVGAGMEGATGRDIRQAAKMSNMQLGQLQPKLMEVEDALRAKGVDVEAHREARIERASIQSEADVPVSKRAFAGIERPAFTGDLPFSLRSITNERGALGVPLDESGRIGPLYHGSPHKFEKFDITKIGTGEGAQAYGHGLYLTENENIARSYRSQLAEDALKVDGAEYPANFHSKFITDGDPRHLAALMHDDHVLWKGGSVEGALAYMRESGDHIPPAMQDLYSRAADELENAVRRSGNPFRPDLPEVARTHGGAVYTTELPDAEVSDFLHWDKPLSEQPEKVQKALRKVLAKHGEYMEHPTTNTPSQVGDEVSPDYTGSDFYRTLTRATGDQWEASDALRQAGVRGVRYLDGSSRRAGEGSYNYAVFDDKDIRILNREGKGALKYLTGLTGAGVGGTTGAAAGGQIGDTPEERRRNAIIGGVVGAVGGAALGVKGGQAVEAMGERGAAPIAPEAPPAKLSEVRLKGEPLQGPLRKPEENTVKRLVLPDALSEQVREIGREFTGPGYESFGQVKRKAQSLLKSGDVPIDFTRGSRAEVLGAAALLRQNTEETGRLAVKLANPKLTDVERAALEQQMAQLEQTSRTLFNSITSAKTEQARDLAANRILANLSNTPEHWQYRAQKIAERPLGDAENAKIRGLLDAGKRDEALRYIGSLKPTTMQERLLSAWKAMLLTNPRTHAANTTSNIVFGLTEEAARNPAAFYDWVATKLIGGDRTKTPTNLAILKASAEGAAKGLRQMPNRLRGLPTGRALEEGVIPHEAQWGHPILTTLFNAPFRFLEAADAPFFESALRGSLAEQATLLAKAEGAKGTAASRRVAALIDSPTDEMVGRALYDAAVRTYKDPTAVGNVLQSVQKQFPVAGNIVMPFTKTPGAVATRFAEYTPYGFFKGARLYKQAIAEAVDGLPNPRLKQMAAENLGRATVGLGPIALGALLYQQGKASGQTDPGDKSARETQYLLGVPNDAFKIGGQWVEPNRLGPQGMLLSLGAVMAQQAAKNEQTPLGAVGGAAFAGVRTVTDQPFLTGVQSLLQAREGADNAARYFANLSGSLVPSVIGAVEATGDPYMRDAQTAGDKLRSRIPGKAEALPTRTDQLGQPAQRFGPGLQNLMSPIRMTPDRVTGNPILEEIRATGAVVPALGKHKDETPQAYQQRATVIGQRVQQAITDLMAAPEYRALPPEQRKDVLEDRVRAVRARAAKYPAGVTP